MLASYQLRVRRTYFRPRSLGYVAWDMVQQVRCVIMRALVSSIPHGADELTPPILAA